MANRTMAAKSLKLKRQRRAWARPLSIAAGITPNRDVIKGYQDSIKSMTMTMEEWDALYKRIFKRDPFVGTPPEQLLARERMEYMKMLDTMRESVPDFLFFKIISNKYERCRMYFNAQRTAYILVHEDYIRGVLRRSISYPSKERAITCWEGMKAIWPVVSPLASHKEVKLLLSSSRENSPPPG